MLRGLTVGSTRPLSLALHRRANWHVRIARAGYALHVSALALLEPLPGLSPLRVEDFIIGVFTGVDR